MSRGVPVTIRGVTYPSFSAAARALNVAPQTVRQAKARGTLHRVGLGQLGKERMPVRIGGVTYADVYAASAALGVSRYTIWAAIHDGDPDRLVRPRVYRAPNERPVTLGGLSWPSMSAASRALDLPPEAVSVALRKGGPRRMERIMAAVMRLKSRQERRAS